MLGVALKNLCPNKKAPNVFPGTETLAIKYKLLAPKKLQGSSYVGIIPAIYIGNYL